MEFAGYIARRYLRSRRHSRFLSRGSVTAITGIAIGVTVLNITLAVMNGFHHEMRRTFVENMPMITVITSEPQGFTDLGRLMDRIGDDPEVVGVSPFIRQVGLATATRTFGPPRIKEIVAWGIEPDLVGTVLPLSQHLLPGPSILDDLKHEGVPRVILGADLANSLYTAVGDTVVLITVNGELDLDRMEAESRKFVVAGFFETGMFEFDSRFVYVDMAAARDFFGYPPGGASMFGVRVTDLMRADRVSDRLEDTLGTQYYATDWMTLNAPLFRWIKLEKIIMILLLG
ncbi:MAG: ABC transporter permease, partial [Candidatus Krumholzibacteriota bacterium]